MQEHTHPVWAILRTLIMMSTLGFVLFLTAEKFDDTEIRTLCYVFLFASTGEVLQYKLLNSKAIIEIVKAFLKK